MRSAIAFSSLPCVANRAKIKTLPKDFLIMARIFRLTTAFLFSVCFFAGTPFGAAAQESYPIGPGDVINVSFIANPEFDRELTVGLNGMINVPLLGDINVQGQSISELRRQIPLLMTGAVIRERINGEYILITVEPDEVFVDVGAYRAFFVDGAVVSPGRQPFEVGMSVRQAIAGAEGLLIRRTTDLNSTEVRNHPRVLVADLIGVLAEIAVQQAILNGRDTIDFEQVDAVDAPEELREEARALAQSQIRTSTDILNEELSFLNTSVEAAEARVISTLRLEEALTEIVVTEQNEVDRVANLVARRLVSSDQLTQTRRLYLQSVDRLGIVQTDRLNAEADRRELVLERNQAVRERALTMQARLQELSQQAAQLQVRIELSSSGQASLGLDANASDTPQIVIFRINGGQPEEIAALPETPVFPGDVINVSF
jgi:polysaccharide export outer membrane protein